jgi:hypothetical protein
MLISFINLNKMYYFKERKIIKAKWLKNKFCLQVYTSQAKLNKINKKNQIRLV